MYDRSDKGSESSGGISSEESQATELKKTCADCGTSKTPLWRGGPAGPKSLCNACGIRSRKKRRAIIGGAEEKKPKKNNATTAADSPSNKLGDSLKHRLLALGREVMMQKKRSSVERQKRQLGEEEQAAVLLMALSCGSVYA